MCIRDRLNAALNTIISWRLDNAFPSIYSLLDYQDALMQDDFSAVPMRKFHGCAFLVFDEDGRMPVSYTHLIVGRLLPNRSR